MKNRQGTYHRLLNADSVHTALLSSNEPFTRADWDRWLEEFNVALNGATLFGTEGVRAAARSLNDSYSTMFRTYLADDAEDDFSERIRRAFRQTRAGHGEALLNLIAAMREDVAPDTEEE